jgi:hypothetical protein
MKIVLTPRWRDQPDIDGTMASQMLMRAAVDSSPT